MKISTSALFARWLWFVYLPLGFFFTLLILTFTELLPRWAIPVLIVFSLWGAVSVRLIVERMRVGLSVPPPRNLVGGSTWIVALVVSGGVLGWIGAARLSTDFGMALALTGAFLVVFGLIAPLFKVLDLVLRAGGRRLAKPRPQTEPLPPRRGVVITQPPARTSATADRDEEDEPLRVAERL